MFRWNDIRSGFHRVRRSIGPAVEPLEHRLLLASQTYRFQNATIEGGGFVDGVFFSPTQQNVIYARTDIGGLYKTTDGGTSWHQLLDFVGSGSTTSGNGTQSQLIGVLSFAIDPENANNIYADVGEYSGTNGAVFYSTNGGTSWGQTNLSFYVGGNSNGRATGERIAVDPYNSNIVLLGSNANGLWKSTNAGHSFSQVSGLSTSASITFVAFKPYGGTAGTSTQNIILGEDSTAGLTPQVVGNAPTNLYQSTNGGAAWSQIAGATTAPGKNVLSTSVTSLSRSGTNATVKTASATGFAAGDKVTIAGATPAAYDGTFTITAVTNSTTFTFDGIASGTDTATGTITASANYSLIPNHAVWASDGNIYLTYSDGLAPNDTQNIGGVYRYNSSTAAWANISPQTPGAGTNASFGYLGLALDPQNNTTIAVTSINRYSANDAIWRTTNSSVATPSWVALYDTSSAQNYGYGGYDTTRNTTNAPWVARFGDGIGNWAATVAIDPFNRGHLLYGDGQGLWATNNATSTSPLTAANSWYFPDYGIEFTAVNSLIAPGSGIPLFSGMGDINGFVHDSLTASPSAGEIDSGYGPLDFDQANANYVVDLGGGTNGGIYSTNDGTTWSAFGAEAGSGGGTIAVSTTAASGTPSIVWSPTGALPYYSNNNGSTWTASTLPSGTLTGGTVLSDRVNAGTFYYTTENSGNNQLSVYKSTNSGVTFTLSGQTNISESRIAANPFVAGDLWVVDSTGIYHSTNSGVSFSKANSSVQVGYSIALGAPAPGRSNAAVYLWGQIGGIIGLYRSDDSGSTFVRINDTADQWGARVGPLAADPNVFGRVYVGINGRGIIIGDPAVSLPSGWSDQDIGAPGNPGSATSSRTLSNGTVVNQWLINGGGAGIAGVSDHFNFAAVTETGDASIAGQLASLTDPGPGISQAGVMFRAGSSAAGDPFAAIVQNTAGQLVFEYRTVSGGSLSSTTLSGVSVGAEHVSLVRTGNTYSAFYATDGVHWTQLGSTVAIAAIPSTANVGLAVTANYDPQLAVATFAGVQIDAPPTVATAAASLPSVVTGTTTNLSVLGADADGESNLTYTWATTGTPPAAVTFSVNSSNSAKNSVATFASAGSYSFTVTISNTAGVVVTSSVNVQVTQTATSIVITPNAASISIGGTQQFSASAIDQFGNGFIPTIHWSVAQVSNSAAGSITSGGLYTAPVTTGTVAISAASGSAAASAAVTVTPVSVISVMINGDQSALAGTQRSMVETVVYTFNGAVALSDTNAFTVAVHAGQTGIIPTLNWTPLNPVNGSSPQWVVTFSGAGVVGGSIADGVYDITLNPANATAAANASVAVQSRPTDTFFRLYGDINGDGRVNNADYNAFLSTYNLKSNQSGYLAAFDVTNSGTKIGNADYNLFLANDNRRFSGFTATI